MVDRGELTCSYIFLSFCSIILKSLGASLTPPLLLPHFIPADCSFSNANGASLGLGFLPCQLATGAVGRI